MKLAVAVSLLFHGALLALVLAWPEARTRSAIAVEARISPNAKNLGETPTPAGENFASGETRETALPESAALVSDGGVQSAAGDAAAPSAPELAAIRSRIEAKLRYPLALRRRGAQGTAALALVIRADGSLEEASLAESSGVAALDELALEAARDAAPFAAPQTPLRLRLPIEFRLRQNP